MPPRYTDSFAPATSISAWFGSLRPKKTQANPTAKNLCTFLQCNSGSDPDTPSPKLAPTPLVTHRINKLLTQPPTSKNQFKSRPPPHPASWYTLHGRSKDFCILTQNAFPGMFHPTLVTPPPCIRVPVYCAYRLQKFCPNPHATLAMGHGVRESLPTVCSVHGSLSPAALLQPHASVTETYTLPLLPPHPVSNEHCPTNTPVRTVLICDLMN